MKRLANIPAVALSAVLLPVLVDTAIKGVLLLTIVGLVAFTMRRVSAATSHLFWMSALAGLLLLPVLSLVMPSWRVLPVWLDTSAMVRFDSANKDLPAGVPVSELRPKREPTRVSDSTKPLLSEPLLSEPLLSQPLSADLPKREAAQTAAAGDLAQLGKGRPFPGTTDDATSKPDSDTAQHDDSRLSLARLAPVFVAVWVSGFVLLTCRVPLSGFALWHLARSAARLTSQRPVELLQQLSAQLGVRQQVQLLSGTRRDMPIVWGIARPKILLPDDWESWDDARLRAVLLHELAHIRRRDALAQLLVQVACALHWFNPLVWLAAFRVRVEREQACDDLVLNNGVRASDYADHLLSIATGYDHPFHANASAFAMARRFKLEGRIMHVLNRNLNRKALSRRMIAASIAAIVSLAVPLAMMQAVATPPVPRDSDAGENGQGTDEDAAAKPDPQIAKWISQLGSKEFNVRQRATLLLTKAGSKALPAVLEAIQSKDAEVRKRAVGIVTRAGSKSIPALLGAIESKQAEVRKKAFEILLALSKSDDEATANAVWKAAEQLLKSPDRRRVAKAREILDNSENYAKRMIRKFGSSNFQIVERHGKVRKLWGNLAEPGLAYLKGLKHLEALALGETEITDAGLEQIKGLTNLKALFVGTSKVTNAGLEHLKGLKSLEHLGLGPSWRANRVNTKITDAGLKHLEGLTKLRTLYLSRANVTDLGPLKRLTNLQNLSLKRTKVTDAGLENLKGLKSLYQLSLSNTNVTDVGLEHLTGLVNLRILNLSGTNNVTNLAQMKGLTKLEDLNLSHSTVTDAGLENLKGLPSLRSLNLSHSAVTDAGPKGLPSLQSLDLSYSTVTDAGLENMKGLLSLRTLDLASTKVTDAGVERLKGLPNLQKLTLSGTQVTGTGLKNLKGLRYLSLKGSTVTDAGLEQMKGLTNLKSLNLISKNVTDAGLEHLKGLTKLSNLNLRHTKVTDAGLEHLKGLPNLSSLDLGSTKVTGAGLKHLKGLTKLDTLTLSKTNVTDGGVEHLKGLTDLRCLYLRNTHVSDRATGNLLLLTNLEYLSLNGTKVTNDGYRILKQALPKCSISR